MLRNLSSRVKKIFHSFSALTSEIFFKIIRREISYLARPRILSIYYLPMLVVQTLQISGDIETANLVLATAFAKSLRLADFKYTMFIRLRIMPLWHCEFQRNNITEFNSTRELKTLRMTPSET